jgi:hypothetical protein
MQEILPPTKRPSLNPMGRPKGSNNRETVIIKEYIEKALDIAGGPAYLARQAEENPVAFKELIEKMIPLLKFMQIAILTTTTNSGRIAIM